jgi:hypothetical protein
VCEIEREREREGEREKLTVKSLQTWMLTARKFSDHL